MTGATPDRREVQRLATREKLLQVSVVEFQRRGFADTDVAVIVERAGVSRGTFYFHFPTKDDVLAELRLREERRIVQKVSRLIERAKLETVLRAVVAAVLEAESRLGVDLVREMCAVQFRPVVVDSESLFDHPVGELVVTAIARAQARKPKASLDTAVDLAVIFLVGMFGLLSTQQGPSAQRDRLIDKLVTVIAGGVSTT